MKEGFLDEKRNQHLQTTTCGLHGSSWSSEACRCSPHFPNEQSRCKEVSLPEVTHGLETVLKPPRFTSACPCTYFYQVTVRNENPTYHLWQVYRVDTQGPVSPALCPTWHSAPHQRPHICSASPTLSVLRAKARLIFLLSLFSLKQNKNKTKIKTLLMSVVLNMTGTEPSGHLVRAMDRCQDGLHIH